MDDGPRQGESKPLDSTGFATLLKGARDVRHEATLQAHLHRAITCTTEHGERTDFDIQELNEVSSRPARCDANAGELKTDQRTIEREQGLEPRRQLGNGISGS